MADTVSFLRYFGSLVLDFLPSSLWDRPVLIRSAPGGGKTSLMRLFTIESLALIDGRRAEFPELVERLTELGALSDEGPRHLGVLLNLGRDYRALLDLEIRNDQAAALFFRLLDARIILATVRSALAFQGNPGVDELQLVPLADAPLAGADGVQALAESLGGLGGPALLDWARRTERAALRPLDSLLPVSLDLDDESVPPLFSLRLLSQTRLRIRGGDVPLRPLVMLDDGHELGQPQRAVLMSGLVDRTLDVARWYSERLEALPTDELMVGDAQGRDYELLELETKARETPRRSERMMLDVASRRARPYLREYGDIERSFMDLIAVDGEDLLGEQESTVFKELWSRLERLTEGHDRYAGWLEGSTDARGYEGAILLRALEIVVHKDLLRPQKELFELSRPYEEFEEQRARVMTSARHFLAREFDLPYYAGSGFLARLGSENIDQFLRLAGDFFEQMLAEITLRRAPRLTAAQQDRIVRRASERYWRELPQRVRDGKNVRRLIAAIVELCQKDTFRDTAPYAPGVTGTALLMSDRERLIDTEERHALRGATELYSALSSAVASNVLSVELEYSVKNQRVMVIYLNRLLCPRFMLPLGRGGFRERKLETMAAWMTGERRGRDDEMLEVHEAGQLTL